MKVTLKIMLEGNLFLPVSGEVERLADITRLGAKLGALPAGARKLMPIVADLPVLGIEVETRASEGQATRRARGKGKGKRGSHASEESSRAAAA